VHEVGDASALCGGHWALRKACCGAIPSGFRNSHWNQPCGVGQVLSVDSPHVSNGVFRPRAPSFHCGSFRAE
jgi:hypothetical protein